MKIKSLRDFLSGLMFIAIGVLFTLGATNDVFGESARPGGGWYALILAALLALLGAIVLFKSLTIETEAGDPVGPVAWRALLAVVVAVVVFGAGIQPLGLLITVPLTVLIANLAHPILSWRGLLTSAAVLTLAAWVVFVLALRLAIPVAPAF